ncbi:MAG: phosphodiesterase [Sulfurospirillaceae bacterium]|nr:phosphodiesterase [Sulfurospirillaceae bacterium]
MKFIHISDTHIISGNKSHYASDPIYKLKKAVESINKYQSGADFAVITGDLSDNGALESYEILKNILDNLSIPYYLILGNHDDRENYLKVFPDPFATQPFTHFSKIIDNSLLLFLDTLDVSSHSGHLCESRFEWLENELAQNNHLPAYIFMHHPPVVIHHDMMDSMGFNDKEEFWKTIEKTQNVKHIFFGHVHLIINGVFNGVGYSSTRSTNHQVALHSSVNEHYNSHESATYAIVSIDSEQVNCITHEYLNEENIYPSNM